MEFLIQIHSLVWLGTIRDPGKKYNDMNALYVCVLTKSYYFVTHYRSLQASGHRADTILQLNVAD